MAESLPDATGREMTPERQLAEDMRALLDRVKSYQPVGMPIDDFYERFTQCFERFADRMDDRRAVAVIQSTDHVPHE